MRGQRGASSVEYAVLIGMLAAVIILAISFLGSTTSSTFHCAGSAMGGNTCVQAVTITTPQEIQIPTPKQTCKSQNKDPGKGCYVK
jgi:Flp pilus assembly pilin Flp